MEDDNKKWAFVKYKMDGVTEVIEISNIKRFDIKRWKEDKNHAFKAKYSRTNEYYRAYVLAVEDSKEKATEEAGKKRFIMEPERYRNFGDDEDISTADETPTVSSVNKVSKSKSTKNIVIENFKNVIVENPNKSVEDETQRDLKKEIKQLKSKINRLEEELKTEKQINRRIQLELLDKLPDVLKIVSKNSNNSDRASPSPSEVTVGTRLGDNVHFGRGVWVPCRMFDHALVRAKTDSMLIKELALAVFTTDELISSSVTGIPCHKLKGRPAKPPLDATKLMAIHDIMRHICVTRGDSEEKVDGVCKMINMKIAEKIMDMIKPSSRKKKGENNANIDDLGENNNNVVNPVDVGENDVNIDLADESTIANNTGILIDETTPVVFI